MPAAAAATARPPPRGPMEKATPALRRFYILVVGVVVYCFQAALWAATFGRASPPPRRPMGKAAAALRWLCILVANIVVYCLQAALWAGSFGAASPPPRRHTQKALAALRWLYFLAADFVVYGFLAALLASSVGVAVIILGRWVCGESSAVSAAGEAVLTCSMFFLVMLGGVFMYFFVIRLIDCARFEAKKRRETLRSSNAIMLASPQGQHPERNGPRCLWSPSLYMGGPLLVLQLIGLGLRMEVCHAKGSLGWIIGSVLVDVACLGLAALICFVFVPEMVILALQFPGRRIWLF